MFDVVAQSSPDDYQSLEILKEAHWKLGNQEEALSVTRKLADAYMRLGQYSSALLEYEGILQQLPEDEEIRGLLEELEGKLHQNKAGSKPAAIALDFGIEAEAAPATEAGLPDPYASMNLATPAPTGEPPATVEGANLIATVSTQVPKHFDRRSTNVDLEVDGNEPMAKFLIQHRLVTHEVVNSAMDAVRSRNSLPEVRAGQALAASLLNEIGRAGADIETILSGIIDRTKFAYAPLENYDVDREIVRMLPEELTVGRLILPFDVVSRTMMVAVDNPFDAGAKAAVMQAVDYHIQWHLALPHVIRKVLRDVYRLEQ